MRELTHTLIAGTILINGIGLSNSFTNESNESTIAHAEEISFVDLTEDHWAYNTVKKMRKQGIVNGYPDGTFHPNKQVTESEFMKMLIQTFVNNTELPKVKNENHWADRYYAFAEKMNYPTIGDRNKPIDRGAVAELVAASQGVHYVGENAVRYLLGEGLSNGRSSATIEGYEADASLTRAEAAQFIMNLKSKNISKLSARPERESDPNQLKDIPRSEKKKVSIKKTFESNYAIRDLVKGMDLPEGTEVQLFKDGDYTSVNVLFDGDFIRRHINIEHGYRKEKIFIQFYEVFGKDEKAFLKDLLKIYYPTSYKEAYNDVIKVSNSSNGRKVVEKTLDGRYFLTQYSTPQIRIGE